LQETSGGDKSGSRRPEIEGLVTAGKDEQPDASPDVQTYQNATARVDQFLEKAGGE
jgi:hypothetical protein